MTAKPGTPILTPTYNTILIMALQDVVRALNDGNYLHAYDCLETLYIMCPPCVETDCEKDWKRYHTELARVSNLRGIDTIQSLHIQTRAAKTYLSLQIRPMLSKIKKSLKEGDYLENEYGAKPRIGKKGHLSLS